MADQPPVAASTELWSPPGSELTPMALRLAPGTASGFSKVAKINEHTFQARRKVNGKLQHVWTSSEPRWCAYIIARLELEPLSEDEIKDARKRAAEEKAEWTKLKRKQAALSRKIERAHERLVAAPKRRKEELKRGAAEAKACRDRQADEWYENL